MTRLLCRPGWCSSGRRRASPRALWQTRWPTLRGWCALPSAMMLFAGDPAWSRVVDCTGCEWDFRCAVVQVPPAASGSVPVQAADKAGGQPAQSPVERLKAQQGSAGRQAASAAGPGSEPAAAQAQPQAHATPAAPAATRAGPARSLALLEPPPHQAHIIDLLSSDDDEEAERTLQQQPALGGSARAVASTAALCRHWTVRAPALWTLLCRRCWPAAARPRGRRTRMRAGTAPCARVLRRACSLTGQAPELEPCCSILAPSRSRKWAGWP